VAQHVSDSVVQVFWKTEGDGKQNLTALEMSGSGYFVPLSRLDMHSVWALLEQHDVCLLRCSLPVTPHGSTMCYVCDRTAVARGWTVRGCVRDSHWNAHAAWCVVDVGITWCYFSTRESDTIANKDDFRG
jgi:hypothetical protein